MFRLFFEFSALFYAIDFLIRFHSPAYIIFRHADSRQSDMPPPLPPIFQAAS